jgi:hypothetical protein
LTGLAALLGVDPELLRLLAALCTLVGAVLSAGATVVGILNRRLRKAAAADAASTRALVEALVRALGVATPAEVRRIADEAAVAAVDERLAPVHQFFAAVELVEHRRTHRPETDIIRILEGVAA